MSKVTEVLSEGVGICKNLLEELQTNHRYPQMGTSLTEKEQSGEASTWWAMQITLRVGFPVAFGGFL